MGAVICGDVGVTGQVRLKADLAECLKIVRAGSPAWCHADDDFESVANEVIARAVTGFDPARGRFSDRLITRAQSRVARGILRSRPIVSRRAEVENLDQVTASTLVEADIVVADPAQEVEAAVGVERFAAELPATHGRVAKLLAQGLNQAEIGVVLGMHPKRVSRVVAQLRQPAAAFFDRPDLLPTAAA